MNRELLVIGGGSQANLIINIINQYMEWFTVVQAKHHTDITDEIKEGVIAIGDNYLRQKIVNYVYELIPDFKFRLIYDPSLLKDKHINIGEGSMVMAATVINMNSNIGRHCLINTGAIIEHDNEIGDFCNIMPGVITGGHVKIGALTQIGMGAMIRDHVTIGNNCTIGMGAVVLKDVPDNSTAWGNPAEIIIPKTNDTARGH